MKAKFHMIICDNPVCDHREDVEVRDMPSFVGRPCPKCGENLLTDADFDHHLLLLAAIGAVPEPTNPSGELTLFSAKDGRVRTAPCSRTEASG